MHCGNEELKIVWAVMVHEWHPELWRKVFRRNSNMVDEIVVRLDMDKCSRNFITDFEEEVTKIRTTDYVHHNFNADVWREQLLRLLDDIQPDIVIALDSDEVFESVEKILAEIGQFWVSDCMAMMCRFNPCLSNNGRTLPIYPSKPHMKIFKWIPNLSFVPYCGYAQVTQYANGKVPVWKCETKINHYCMWTREMEEAKRKEVKERYGRF